MRMKPRGNRIVAVCLALCLSLCLFTSCAQKGGSALTQINVACFPNITHAQALLMKGRGTLEKAFGDGVKVNWITFNAGPAEIEALFAGQVDIGYIGPVPAISGYIQSGGDLQVIAGAVNGGAVLVAREGAGITSAKDLDGKTVAVPQFGNTQHLSLLALLSANGLAPTTSGGTVKVVQSANADTINLMDQKNIDAALVPEPWGSMIEAGGQGKVALDYDRIDPSGAVPSAAVVIVRKDFLNAHPDAVATFIKAHKDATDSINSNTADALKVINDQITAITQSSIDPSALESSFKRMQVSYDIPTDSINEFAQICLDQAIITKLPDANIINSSFLK